jgi:hypothetical protein
MENGGTTTMLRVGGVAAVLAAGLVLAPILGGSSWPSGLIGSIGPDGDGPASRPVDAAAAAVLRDAARFEAEREPWAPRPDQFVYRKYVESHYMTREVDGRSVERLAPGRGEDWLSVDGRHPGLTKGWIEPGLSHPAGGRGSESLAPCPEGTRSWCMKVQAYPPDLPVDGDPDAMLRYLRDGGPGPEALPGGSSGSLPDSGTFEQAEELLALGGLPPQTRSALLAALAQVPGVTVAGDAVDAAGRPGVAVGRTLPSGERHELVLDRGTGELLGLRQLWAPDQLADGGVPATEDGASWELAFLESGVVDRVGQKP